MKQLIFRRCTIFIALLLMALSPILAESSVLALTTNTCTPGNGNCNSNNGNNGNNGGQAANNPSSNNNGLSSNCPPSGDGTPTGSGNQGCIMCVPDNVIQKGGVAIQNYIDNYKQNNPGQDPPIVCGDTATNTSCGQNGCDLVQKYVNPLINVLSIIVGLVAVISIVAGAIQYITSTGDPQKTSAAKSRISKTIFALVAYGFLYAFLQFIIPGGIF